MIFIRFLSERRKEPYELIRSLSERRKEPCDFIRFLQRSSHGTQDGAKAKAKTKL